MNNSKPKTITPEQALQRMSRLCAASEQAQADVRAKLARMGIAQADADAIVQRLVDKDFLNEERYARAYCHDKVAFARWGRNKVRHMLRQKGVSDDVIDRALQHEASDGDLQHNLQHLLQQRMAELQRQGREPLKARAALVRLAASRGYEADQIFPAVSQLMRGYSNTGGQ